MESSECQCLLAVYLFSINYKKYKGMFLGSQAKSFIFGESVMSTFKILGRIYLGVGVVFSYKAI